jgi:tRNA modification GTPase
VRIVCLESTRPIADWQRGELEQTPADTRVVVLTKIDLATPSGLAADVCRGGLPDAVPTSSVTGEGIDRLRRRLREAVISAQASATEVVAGTAVRCRESLRLAAASLKRARRLARRGTGEELVAAEVRVALGELGKVVGAVYTDDVLDRVFSRFCIGK